MRLVITFFIPAMEKRAIKWMFHDVFRVGIDIFNRQPCHELRNPLAFIHESLNLLAAQMMSKPACISFPEEQDCPPYAAGLSHAARLCPAKK